MSGLATGRTFAPIVSLLMLAGNVVAAASDRLPRDSSSALSPAERQDLAVHLAPVLMVHADEPFGIDAVVPVFHPRRPLVAYHIFFEEDALLAGRGEPSDHEVVWVVYDPQTFAVVDVRTLWHRAVLRTDACVEDAQASGSHPKLEVQWGQHGILPLGWEANPNFRTRFLLRLHYFFMRHVNTIPGLEAHGYHVRFDGTWQDYRRFSRRIDLADYVRRGDVVVEEHCAAALAARFPRPFQMKKEWPDP